MDLQALGAIIDAPEPATDGPLADPKAHSERHGFGGEQAADTPAGLPSGDDGIVCLAERQQCPADGRPVASESRLPVPGRHGREGAGMDGLTPLQRRVAEDVLSIYLERPVAEPWGQDLTTQIEEALEDHAERIQGERLFLGKRAVSDLLACEARHAAPQEPFRWSPRAARGEIIHRAIARAAAGDASGEHGLAVAAIDQALGGNSSLGRWLRAEPEQNRVAVVAEALPGVASFLSSWPPIRSCWGLIPEYPVGAELLGGRVRVAGRVDLALGSTRAGADKVLRRRQILIELKSGVPSAEHRSEHLMYALLETLRTGVAPWRAVTFWLDNGTFLVDTITIDLLDAAAARLTEAIRRSIELSNGRPPSKRAGWRCSFCALSPDCEERQRAEDQEWRSSDDRS